MTITIDGLTFSQGGTQFCFTGQLQEHRCTALLGASGAGKSTLLNLLAGFLHPTGGNIDWQGQSLLTLLPAQRPFTSLFQEHNLFNHLNLFDNVALGLHPGLKLNEGQRHDVQQALSKVGLGGKEQRLPESLSGGQKQRAALARALIRRQPWLLLDEPLSALDPGLRQDMIALLQELQTNFQLSMLLVTHDPEEALQLASMVMFIGNGEVYWQGESRAFLEQTGDVIQTYLGTSNSR